MSEHRPPGRFSASTEPKDGFWSRAFAGFRAILPVLAGVIPFALIAGAAPIQEGISAAATIGMSLIVFAGVAQLVAAQLIGSGAAPWLVVFTVVVINLRMMMYSASLAPYLGEPPARWKALISYLLTDQAYAVSVPRFSGETAQEETGEEGTESQEAAVKAGAYPGRVGYYLGAAVAMWVVWQTGTVSGIALGARVPDALALDFAMPLVFLALMFSAITSRASSVAAFGAGAMALISAGLPLNLGLIAAIAAGVLAGTAWPSLGRAPGRGRG
jgi:predicted branched-subunit amino acid permease